MATMMPDNADSQQQAPLGEEPTHGVCACQVDATPRLALCGVDCSGEDERWTDTVCVVCFDLLHRPCPHCGSRA